jgi:hypothetical protein
MTARRSPSALVAVALEALSHDREVVVKLEAGGGELIGRVTGWTVDAAAEAPADREDREQWSSVTLHVAPRRARARRVPVNMIEDVRRF